MVGRSLDAHNECNAPALMEETPKALRVAVVEDDPQIQQLISANQASNRQDGCAQESYGWDTNSGPAAPGFSP